MHTQKTLSEGKGTDQGNEGDVNDGRRALLNPQKLGAKNAADFFSQPSEGASVAKRQCLSVV